MRRLPKNWIRISVLLIDVLIGVTVELIIHLLRGVRLNNLFKIHFTREQDSTDTLHVKIIGSALFSNFTPLKKTLNTLGQGSHIIFYFSGGYLIDHTVLVFY